MPSPAAKLAASVAFLERFRADREAGRRLGLEEYRAAFPGFEDVVDAEWERLAADAEGRDVGSSTPPTGPDRGGRQAPDLAGASFGAYRIEREIGRGGQGAVYLAQDVRLGRRVALKILPGAWGLDAGALRRFVQEGRALAALDHPGICAVYEASMHDGSPFMAMRYVEGETLSARLARRRGPPDAAEIDACVAIVAEAARAVHAAHDSGFIHRDLKPANLMVQPDGRPVILDFGLARSAADAPDLTRTGDLLGTPAYMAPEQAAGDLARIDRRTDVYALGVVLYQAVTGVRPFEAPTTGAILDAVRRGAATPPREQHRAVGRDLDVVVRTAMARDPVDRYVSALELAEDLRRLLAHEPLRARPIPWYGRLRRWARRKPATAALTAAIFVLIPVAAAFGGMYVADRPAVHAQERAVRRRQAEQALEQGFSLLRAEIAAHDLRAVEIFTKAQRLAPDSAEAFAGRVRAELRAKRPQLATAAVDEFERAHGVGPLTRRMRAEILRESGRFDEAAAIEAELPPPLNAAECFLEGIRWQALGRGMRSLGDEDEKAVEWFEKAMMRSATFRELFLNALAVSVGRTKRLDAARRTAETARAMVGGARGEMLAGLALTRSDPEAATAAYREVVRRDPGLSVEQGLSTVFASLGRFTEAAEVQREAVRRRPDDASAHYNLSLLLLRSGEPAEAESAARRAVALRPDLADMHVQLAVVRGARDAPLEELTEIFAAGAAAEPANAVVRGHYAAHLNAIGRKADAVREARATAALRPRETTINVAISRLLAQEDPAVARACMLRVVEATPDAWEPLAMVAVLSAMLDDGPAATEYADRAEKAAHAKPGGTIGEAYRPQFRQIRERFGAGNAATRPAAGDADPLDVP